MDTILIALLALLLNLLFGGPRFLFEKTHLVRLGRIPAKLLRDFEPRFNRQGAHALLVAYALAGAFMLGLVLHYLFKLDSLKLLEAAVVAILLPMRPAFERVWQMRQALLRADMMAARRSLEGTVWKHHILLDAHGAARAGIELLAVNAVEKILCPLLWYLILGLPGLFAAKMATLLKETLPASFTAQAHIDRLTLRLPALMLWLASRLASLLWIASAMVIPGMDMGKVMAKFGGDMTRAPALPYTLFSMAALLNLSLAGPTSAYINTQWIGDGTPKATPAEMGRALALYGLGFLVVIILLGLSL